MLSREDRYVRGKPPGWVRKKRTLLGGRRRLFSGLNWVNFTFMKEKK